MATLSPRCHQWPRCSKNSNAIFLPKQLHHLKITPSVLESIIQTISLAYIEFQFPFPSSMRPFNFLLTLWMIRPAIFDLNIQ